MIRYVLAWLPMLAIAVANGAFREAVLAPRLSAEWAHRVSTVILLALLSTYLVAVLRRWPPRSTAHASAIGVTWMVLTLAFEFGFGHYVGGRTWGSLLAEYDVAAGRVWGAVPLLLLLAPLVASTRAQRAR